MKTLMPHNQPQEAGKLFAQVAIDQPLDGTLTYCVPAEFQGDLAVGARVEVPLGRSNRLVSGTVVELTSELPPVVAPAAPEPVAGPVENAPELFAHSPLETTPKAPIIKAIREVVSDIQPVPEDLLALSRWISAYYCAPLGQTLATMVPAAVKKNARLPAKTFVHLLPAPEALPKLSPKTKALYERFVELLTPGPLLESEVLTKLQIARPMLKRLAEKGLLRWERRVEWPGMGDAEPAEPAEPLILTVDQKRALEAMEEMLENPRFAVRLIHGVTGSGKTELYIRAIERVVAKGRQAILLVPEIALTPQMVRRFTQRFPRVAVLHSGLKPNQRHLHWHAIATGWAQVIIGARSAIFAPAPNLGLIVVDEEHEPSYKQENAPRYHARDVAIRRAQMRGIPILLGSATPALETWVNAQRHPAYQLLSLPTRPKGLLMPRVSMVDMRQQSKERRGLHILSTVLEHHLKQVLEKKKQAIFLLNRRGYAHYVMCPRCDWVLMCENCDATMVVHRSTAAQAQMPAVERHGDFALRYGKVECHYCMTSQILPNLCPVCHARLTHLGQGTQRAEDELIRKFPHLRMARMDSDSMRDAIDYQETLAQFGRGELDLLIGTQMIAKGLDFPNVQLVGVLNADLAMTMPDFRATERTFQLICQVAGRAGRSNEQGTVIVQTFQPQEPALLFAAEHDYEGFVEQELPHRKEFLYPPYGRVVRLLLSHKGQTKVQEAAEELVRQIEAIVTRQSLPVRWHGPQPPSMERLVEEYRHEILLMADSPLPLQKLLNALRSRELLFGTPVSVAVDVDPLHML